MEYVAPNVNQYDAIMQPHNPMLGSNVRLVSEAIALGPTRVMGEPDAGFAEFQQTGLDGWRDAMDVFSAVNFLFPA
jgi:hypothetical protein